MAAAVTESALWTRSFVLNIGIVFVCSRLLSGFRIHGISSYVITAAAMTLPTVAFMLAVHVLRVALSESVNERTATGAVILIPVLMIAALVIGTGLPDLLVAEWITPRFRIDGIWTYAASCGITAIVLLCFRQQRALRWLRVFINGPSQATPSAAA
jgi:hypothetical protein